MDIWLFTRFVLVGGLNLGVNASTYTASTRSKQMRKKVFIVAKLIVSTS